MDIEDADQDEASLLLSYNTRSEERFRDRKNMVGSVGIPTS